MNRQPMNASAAALAGSQALDPEPLDLAATAKDESEAFWINRRATEQAHRAAVARHASGRRRFVDPTTCDREYSEEELEFMQAMQDYKKSSGRMFPTWSEVLEVLRALGYEKPEAAEADAQPEAAVEPDADAGAPPLDEAVAASA